MSKDSKIGTYLEWGLLLLAIFGTFKLLTELGLASDLKPETAKEKYIMWIGLLVIGFIALGVHELGHLLTGLLQGFTFQLFVVGPLGIKREDDEVKIYLNTNLGYYGGVAATSPSEDHPDNAKRFGRLLLAGPIASLIFAVICILSAGWIGKPLGFIVYAGGAISIAIFYATTIPSRTGMFFTDRKRYQRLVTPGKDQDVELAMLRIMGQYSQSDSYKDVNKEDIEKLVNDELPFLRFYGLYNLICYQIEIEKKVEATAMQEYESIALDMPKSMVKALNAEIEKMKTKYLAPET